MQQSIQQLPHAVFVIDQTGLIVEGNEPFLYATGYSEEEVRKQPFSRILCGYKGTIEQLYGEWLKQEAETGSPMEVEWQDKAGNRRRTLAMIMLQQSGAPLYTIHFFQLTREATASTLPERMAHKLMSEANLGLVLLDAEARIVDISLNACRLLGIERLSALNKHIDLVFAGIPEEHRLIKREVLRGVRHQNIATSWTNNNQRYELLVDSNVLQDETGKTIGAYVFFKDITNIRSFEQKIERSDRLAMIGQIAAGAAHEIRNPLTSIKGFLQMFLQTFAENRMERERTYTEIMLTEINRINALVSEFLLLSKPRDVQYALVDLNMVFEEIMPIVESEALLNGIEVELLSKGEFPLVVGDNELLKQVFLNICKNGIEAMGDRGRLQISYHYDESGDRVSINIHDTGPGIPPYIIDKIFDPFYTTKEEGTGLGLSVCQKIVHDIGGQIRVSSKGYGTTFHILLPYL
nr:PAS domain-containing sensor histidine kinase [Brevibacillus fulvus]